MHSIIHHKFSPSIPVQLSLQRLLTGICFSGFSVLWVMYLYEKGLNDVQIGMVSTLLVFIMILASVYTTRMMATYRAYKVYIVSALLIVGSYIVISFTDVLWLFLGVVLFYGIVTELNWSSFQILFRENITLKNIGREEGLLYTFINIGWFVGPMIVGIILSKFPIHVAFYVITIIMATAFFVFTALHLKRTNRKKVIIPTHSWRNVKDFFMTKRTRLPYLVSLGGDMFYALVSIYVPIMMLKYGLSESLVAYFFAATMIPLVLFEYFAGKSADKVGVKRFFAYGYMLLCAVCLLCFFITDIYIMLILLFFAHIIMAFNEPLKEIYFFKSIRSYEEEQYYPLFNTYSAVGSLIGRFSCAVALLFFPIQVVFVVTAFWMAVMSLVSMRI